MKFGPIISRIVIDMNEQRLSTVAQLRAFVDGTEEVQFEPLGEGGKRNAFTVEVVSRLRYRRLERSDKGVVMRYLGRTTNYSRPQLTRLVGRAVREEILAKRYSAPKKGFPRKFTARDVVLRVEFAKSRPRHNNDNGLAETKNGAIVRKHLDYSHIPQRFANQVNVFCRDVLNPYVNFHRPCFFRRADHR